LNTWAKIRNHLLPWKIKNSSELRLPSQLASNTWKIMSTTLSVKSTPQTYSKQYEINKKADIIFVNNWSM
jgi:hypothetical protein